MATRLSGLRLTLNRSAFSKGYFLTVFLIFTTEIVLRVVLGVVLGTEVGIENCAGVLGYFFLSVNVWKVILGDLNVKGGRFLSLILVMKSKGIFGFHRSNVQVLLFLEIIAAYFGICLFFGLYCRMLGIEECLCNNFSGISRFQSLISLRICEKLFISGEGQCFRSIFSVTYWTQPKSITLVFFG